MTTAPTNRSPRRYEDLISCTPETDVAPSRMMRSRNHLATIVFVGTGLLCLSMLFFFYMHFGSNTLFPLTAQWTEDRTAGGSYQEISAPGDFLQDIVEIVAGDAHTCARNTLGEVFCWGDNEYGQLGDGTTTNRLIPARVSPFNGPVQSLMAGGNHTCAIVENPLSEPSQPGPIQSDAAKVNSAKFNLSRIDTVHQAETIVYCWGSNSHGQLGIEQSDTPTGTQTSSIDGEIVLVNSEESNSSSLPQPVSGLTATVQSLAAGELHTCALSDTGAVYCWGSNSQGQLGIGSVELDSEAGNPDPDIPDPNSPARERAADDSATPALVIGLGGEMAGLPEEEWPHMIEAGGSHTCATTSTRMLCWGNNEFGQLGDGTTEDRYEPTQISGPSANVLAMGLGRLHTCVLASNGTPFCWGSNFYGQLGNGTDGFKTDKFVATQVKGLPSNLAEITSRGNHTCALTDGQDSYCWGFNLYGQLGDGTTENRNRPASVSFSGRESLSILVAGHNHTCGLFNAKTLCWGHNFSGQLGDASREGKSAPSMVAAPLARTFLSYVAQPDMNLPTPTPIPPPSWERIGQGGLSVRTVEVIPQQNESTVVVGIVEPPAGAKGLYQTTLGAECTYPNNLTEGALTGSVMDVEMLDNTGVLANFDTNFYYTVDGGLSWQRSTSPEQVNPYSVTYDLAHGWFAGTDQGLFRSQDNGLSWSLVNDDKKEINVVYAVNGEIWVGTDKSGLHAFNPLNLRYRELVAPTESVGGRIWDILVDESINGERTYFLATGTGVYQGTNGTDWTQIGGTALAGVEVRSLAVVSVEGAAAIKRLYIGTMGNGVWQIPLDAPNSSQSITSAGWNPSITVRYLGIEDQYCQGVLAGTDDGLWVLRNP